MTKTQLIYLILFSILEKELDNKCCILAMRLLSRNCVLHEINRQNIMKTKILIYLKKFVKEESPEANVSFCITQYSIWAIKNQYFEYIIVDHKGSMWRLPWSYIR